MNIKIEGDADGRGKSSTGEGIAGTDSEEGIFGR